MRKRSPKDTDLYKLVSRMGGEGNPSDDLKLRRSLLIFDPQKIELARRVSEGDYSGLGIPDLETFRTWLSLLDVPGLEIEVVQGKDGPVARRKLTDDSPLEPEIQYLFDLLTVP